MLWCVRHDRDAAEMRVVAPECRAHQSLHHLGNQGDCALLVPFSLWRLYIFTRSVADIHDLQFVAIIAVNAAPIKPLFSSARWLKSTSKGGTDSHTPYAKRSNTYALSGRSKSKGSQLRSVLPFHTNPAGTQILSSSEEDIVKGGAGTRSHISQSSTAQSIDMSNAQRINDGGIVVTTTYQVKDDGSHMQSQESDGKW